MARILIVDDDPSTRTALREMLKVGGHQVSEAADGTHVIRLLKAETPDLLITDILMPDKEGLETIQDVRAAYPALPIVAMTGGGLAAGSYADYLLSCAEDFGATRTLRKPVDMAELLQLVEDCLA
jgi:CheY-like chemotaxis protein